MFIKTIDNYSQFGYNYSNKKKERKMKVKEYYKKVLKDPFELPEKIVSPEALVEEINNAVYTEKGKIKKLIEIVRTYGGRFIYPEAYLYAKVFEKYFWEGEVDDLPECVLDIIVVHFKNDSWDFFIVFRPSEYATRKATIVNSLKEALRTW